MGDTIKSERLKLSGTTDSPQIAESFFKEVEKTTGVSIRFDSSQFASTYKRDPVINIFGPQEAIRIAKEIILCNLEIHSNRIVLKMDISHEEHPSLIGKKGCLIKKVMESTNTHIHFPDTNKIPENIKSNHVSIAGEPSDVRRAKIMLRTLLPFQVMFNIDASNNLPMVTTLPIWKSIQEKLHLDISFVTQKNVTTVVLRICQGLFPSARQLILAIIEFLTRKRGSDLPDLTVVMDITPQHHHIVKGERSCNIQAIVKRTGAKIQFSNLNSNPPEFRGLTITGNLDCVYMAWQEVIGFLPICVSFDVSENREISDYMDYMLDSNISVSSRIKPKYCVKSISVKGPEKYSKQIIQYRQKVLKLPAIKFQQDIHEINRALNFLSSTSEHSKVAKTLSNDELEDIALNICNFFRSMENNFPLANMPRDVSLFLTPECNNMPIFLQNKYDHNKGNNVLLDSAPSLCETYANLTSTNNISNSAYSPFPSDLWTHNTAVGNNNNNNKAVINNPHELRDRPSSVSDMYPSNESHVTLDSPIKKSGMSEYEIFEKRLSAYQAIHRRIESPQVPSNLWAGYGFSQSMPATCANKDAETLSPYSSRSLESNCSSSSEESWENIVLSDFIDDKTWTESGNNKDSVFSMSNVFDFKRNTSIPMKSSSEDILPRLLYDEGLYNYIDVFLREEIDYDAFLLLNESDLFNMGINYQARMKITCLIRELQDAEVKRRTFNAAPGAGRKLGDSCNNII